MVESSEAIKAKIENGKVKVQGKRAKWRSPELTDKPSAVISPPKEAEEVEPDDELKMAPDEVESVKVAKVEKAKKQKADKIEKPAKVTFPAEGKINAYNYIHLSNAMMNDLGFPIGKISKITIDKTSDGALVIRKRE